MLVQPLPTTALNMRLPVQTRKHIQNNNNKILTAQSIDIYIYQGVGVGGEPVTYQSYIIPDDFIPFRHQSLNSHEYRSVDSTGEQCHVTTMEHV